MTSKWYNYEEDIFSLYYRAIYYPFYTDNKKNDSLFCQKASAVITGFLHINNFFLFNIKKCNPFTLGGKKARKSNFELKRAGG